MGTAFSDISLQEALEQNGLHIVAATTDAELEEIDHELTTVIDTVNPDSVVVVEGLLDALVDYRDHMRCDARADLEYTRRRIEELQVEIDEHAQRRNYLVRRIAKREDSTDTDRKLAEHAGVSHTSIRNTRTTFPGASCSVMNVRNAPGRKRGAPLSQHKNRSMTSTWPASKPKPKVSDGDREPCPACGATVRHYNGKPERHPSGGKKTGAWVYCTG